MWNEIPASPVAAVSPDSLNGLEYCLCLFCLCIFNDSQHHRVCPLCDSANLDSVSLLRCCDRVFSAKGKLFKGGIWKTSL